MKTIHHFTLPLLALAATTLFSCSEESWFEKGLPDPKKELVAFSSQDGQVTTRAGLHASAETKIVARFKSEDIETTAEHTAGAPRYTRTVLTGSAEKVQDHDTKVHYVLSDTHSDVDYASSDYYRYWDDAYGRYAKLSVYAVAVPGKKDDSVLSDEILAGIAGCSGSSHNVTNITNGATKVSNTNPYWFTEPSENETCVWTLPTTEQTTTTNAEKDLCYSNNIEAEGKKGVYKFKHASGSGWSIDALVDGQMFWRPSENGSTVGKFDQGNLIFKHALSKITINITEGNGFNNTVNTDFIFKTGTNVELLNFPYTGTLNVATGVWSNPSSTKIAKLEEITPQTVDPKTVRTVTGLTLPDKTLKDVPDNALHFVIDDNDYYVTCAQIATAIQKYYTDGDGKDRPEAATLKNFTQMKQGEHYVINITVAKTKIENITAQLIGWEEVNSANIDPSNAYVTVTLEERTSKTTTFDADDADKFDLYRKASYMSKLSTDYNEYINDYNAFADYNWGTGYTTDGMATKSWSSNKWVTEWYWPDNLTYYHFRVAGNTGGTNPTVVERTTPGDYFALKSGNITGTTEYQDYIWGAPFTDVEDSYKFKYTVADGFNQQEKVSEGEVTSSQIYKAIGATKDKINMMLFHMTSQVFFEVKTTTDEGKVALRTGTGTDADPYNDTKVEILRFYKDGTVLMGTGKVDVSGDLTNTQEIEFVSNTAATSTTAEWSKFQYGVVPQSLDRFTSGTDSNDFKVGIRITTPDGNQYVVQDISSVYAKVTNNNLNIPYTVSSGSGSDIKYKINRWYPGYQYTYTVTISKTKIENITAQLVDWETVRGDLGNITLED